jgi:tetratricopeptide (TPR) repeat protein
LEALLGLPDDKVSTGHLKKMLYCARRLLMPQKALDLLERHAGLLEKGEKDILSADILYEKGDFAEAQAAYEKAAQAGFAPGRAWLMAGHAALADDKPEKARHAFAQSARFESHSKEAAELLKKF